MDGQSGGTRRCDSWTAQRHDDDSATGPDRPVHHVAMAVAESAEQLRIRAQLVQLGWQVTPVRDRQYFQSIYFREPGGVLFEVATLAPGFAVDEPLEELGRGLKLPPW